MHSKQTFQKKQPVELASSLYNSRVVLVLLLLYMISKIDQDVFFRKKKQYFIFSSSLSHQFLQSFLEDQSQNSKIVIGVIVLVVTKIHIPYHDLIVSPIRILPDVSPSLILIALSFIITLSTFGYKNSRVNNHDLQYSHYQYYTHTFRNRYHFNIIPNL